MSRVINVEEMPSREKMHIRKGSQETNSRANWLKGITKREDRSHTIIRDKMSRHLIEGDN